MKKYLLFLVFFLIPFSAFASSLSSGGVYIAPAYSITWSGLDMTYTSNGYLYLNSSPALPVCGISAVTLGSGGEINYLCSLNSTAVTDIFNNNTVGTYTLTKNHNQLCDSISLTSCESNDDNSLGNRITFIITSKSTVTTTASPTHTDTTATLAGAITVTGGSNATQSGIAYGTSSTLATTIATTTLGAQTGTASFSSSVTGLTGSTTYYFRAYATNTGGTGYGLIQTFTTSSSVCSPATVSNGTVNAYPACTITCDSGYHIVGSACIIDTGVIKDTLDTTVPLFYETTGFDIMSLASTTGNGLVMLFAGNGLAIIYQLRGWIVALVIIGSILLFAGKAFRFFKH